VAPDATPILFGDLRRGYTIVDRVSLSVLRDPFTQATSGNVRFIARRRVGGQVVLPEALRRLKVAV
jgi:HK97 family phage major capsid protein